ncbi:7852_t:CDS:10, partial [Cetraspora pellucida]
MSDNEGGSWEKKLKFLDIGTGCGNIVISLAKNRPADDFLAVDINEQALKVAKINAARQEAKNIRFIKSDLFSNIDKKEKFNIIMANPPYVSESEYQNLVPAVKEQPRKALIAANEGYFFYQKIFRQARHFFSKKIPFNATKVTVIGKAGLAERVYNSKSRYSEGRRSLLKSLSKSQIDAVIGGILEEIEKALIKGEKVSFPGYFSLQTTLQKARVAMNLQTKKKMNIPAKRVPKAKFSLNGRAIAFQAIDGGLSLTSGEDKYEVRTKDHKDQVVKFANDAKNDSTAEEGIELEFRKDGTSDKGVKIAKKQLKSGVELKEEVQPWAGVGFVKSRKLPFWAVVIETDLDTFLQNNHDKLVLVKFSTTWCPPCRVLQKNIQELMAELEKSAAPKKDLLVLEQSKMIRKNNGVLGGQKLRDFIEDRGFESRTGHQIIVNYQSENVGSIPVASARFVSPHRAIGRRSGLKIRPVWVRVPLWAPLE